MTPIDLTSHTFSDQDVLELTRGETYVLSAPLIINQQNITIKASDGAGPRPIIIYSYAPPVAGTLTAAFTFTKNANFGTVQDLDIRPTGPGNYAIWLAGGQGHQILRNYVPSGGIGFLNATGVKDLIVDGNTADLLQGYFIDLFPDPNQINVNVNTNVTIQNNRCLGSSTKTVVRAEAVDGLVFSKNVLFNRNWNPLLTISFGANLVCDNNFLYGPCEIGPDSSATGGVNETDPVKKAQKLAQRWNTASIKGNTVRGDWRINAGVTGLTMEQNCFKHVTEESSGSPLLCGGVYGTRPLPVGVIRDNTAEYAGGTFVNSTAAFASLDYLNNGNTFNGTLVGNSSSQGKVGINLEAIADYDRSYAFINRIKHCRRFGLPNTGYDQGCPIDADGNPTQDFGTFWDRQINMNGTYKFSCKPRGGTSPTVVAKQNCTVANVVYSGGVLSADVTISQPANTEFSLSFAVTGTIGGATDVRLLCPGYADDSAVFTTEFKTLVSKFAAIRVMDWMQTNSTTVTTWASRRQPSYAFYSGVPGVPVEVCIDLANALALPLWLNVPIDASADWLQGLANYISANLKPGIPVYVEWSNEVWNGIFPQFLKNYNAAQIEAKTDPQLTAGGTISNPFYIAQRRVAKKLLWVRSILGITNRYRYVLAGQLANPWTVSQGLDYITKYYGKPADFLYGIAPAVYFNAGADSVLGSQIAGHYIAGSYDVTKVELSPNATFTMKWMAKTDATTVASILARISDRYHVTAGTLWQSWKAMARAANLALVHYEGGPDFEQWNCNVDTKIAADSDAGMRDIIKNYVVACIQDGCDLHMYFSSTGAQDKNRYWELTTDARDLTQPKMLGMLDALAAL